MADSTDPPTTPTPSTNVTYLDELASHHGINPPPTPTVYVCGERFAKCVCIENHVHNPHPDTQVEDGKIWHVCYLCGDEWYTR